MGWVSMDLNCFVSGQEYVTGACECDNEILGSIKFCKFLNQLRTC